MGADRLDRWHYPHAVAVCHAEVACPSSMSFLVGVARAMEPGCHLGVWIGSLCHHVACRILHSSGRQRCLRIGLLVDEWVHVELCVINLDIDHSEEGPLQSMPRRAAWVDKQCRLLSREHDGRRHSIVNRSQKPGWQYLAIGATCSRAPQNFRSVLDFDLKGYYVKRVEPVIC